jgi:hypothetical protein
VSHTAASAFFQERRAEFEANAANRALSAMRKGALLRLQYRDGRPSWSLDGRPVPANVANILVDHALVMPTSGALFSNLFGQEWSYRHD